MDEKQRESGDDSVRRDDETVETEAEEPVTSTEAETGHVTEPVATADKNSRLKRFWATYKAKKKLSIPFTLVGLIALLLLVPPSRYLLLGTFMKNNFSVTVLDSTTSQPVSNVDVSLGGSLAKTDNEGIARLRTKVGSTQMTVSKKYYREASQRILVPLGSKQASLQVKLEATGRQVPVQVHNKINGHLIENATIKAADSEVQTDDEGKAVIVLPPDSATVEATISADGLNELRAALQVTDKSIKENEFPLTPSGKLYFLSKLSGKLDVVKTDLDGANRQTVLAGTGREEEYSTVLLASRDWKYLALLARREGEKDKLYLIDTQNDNKLTTMDEGDATFSPVGWYNEHFVFQVHRNKETWADKRTAIKSYTASTHQLRTLDETAGQGAHQYEAVYENFGNIYILDNLLVYPKYWIRHYYGFSNLLEGKQNSIVSVRPDGSDKKTLKTFATRTDGNYSAIDARLYEPQEVYFQVHSTTPPTFYEYEDGSVKDAKDTTAETFNRFYPTYLVSPSGKQTFWFEERDGKNVLFLGDNNGEDKKQIASLSEYTPYGWYSDDYLLVSKKSSELFIMPAGNVSNPDKVLKVTDYHRAGRNFSGYGYGYGGL